MALYKIWSHGAISQNPKPRLTLHVSKTHGTIRTTKTVMKRYGPGDMPEVIAEERIKLS
jgi:hypothetical protein